MAALIPWPILVLNHGIYRHCQGALHQVREVLPQSDGFDHWVVHRALPAGEWQLSPAAKFQAATDFVFVGKAEDLEAAMEDIFSGILASARSTRSQSEGYAQLFKSYQDGGLAHAINKAEQQMLEVVFCLEEVIQSHTGANISPIAHEMLLGLPLVYRLIRADIEKSEGYSLCADKTRLVIRNYFREIFGLPVPPALAGEAA